METLDVHTRVVAPARGQPPCPPSTDESALVPWLGGWESARSSVRDRVGAEWRWVAVAAIATLILIELPFLFAYSQTLPDRVFVSIWAPHDYAQYAAAMREGASSGSWLIHDHLTGEPHDPVFMYTLYVALGKLAAALGLDFELAYHLAEVAARAVLLVAVYAFASAVLSTVHRRRLAFVLTLFTSGLAVFAVGARVVGAELGTTPAELNWPEVNTFLVLLTAPHLQLGLAFLLLAARYYLVSWTSTSVANPAVAGAMALALGLTNPFSLVTLCVVVTVHLGLMWLPSRALPRRAIWSGITILLGSAPLLAYNLLAFAADPFWSLTYGQQNVQPSPPPIQLVLGLGGLLVFTLSGLRGFLRRPTPGTWFVLVWIALSLGLMYAPLQVQRRFAFGLHPLLAVVAAVGLEPVWRWARRERRFPRSLLRPLSTLLLAQVLFGSTAILYAAAIREASDPYGRALNEASGFAAQAAAPGSGVFQSRSLKDTALWLAGTMGPNDVVLAENATGNYLAAFIPGRVFVGHWVATLDHGPKQAATRRFYRGDLQPEERRRFLAANNIRYVVYGPIERARGGSLPILTADLVRVATYADVTVYEVAPPLPIGRRAQVHGCVTPSLGERPARSECRPRTIVAAHLG